MKELLIFLIVKNNIENIDLDKALLILSKNFEQMRKCTKKEIECRNDNPERSYLYKNNSGVLDKVFQEIEEIRKNKIHKLYWEHREFIKDWDLQNLFIVCSEYLGEIGFLDKIDSICCDALSEKLKKNMILIYA